ncbi:MAG: hypothetical protein R2795_23375 [Saprospiraceae bacterium]
MKKTLISIEKALTMISKGESIEYYDVEINSPIDAVKAFHLRKKGVEVPDSLISYDDNDLAYDDDFDHEEWTKMPKKIDENKFELACELSLNEEELRWLGEKNIAVNTLLSQLLKNFIETNRLIQQS